MAKIMNNVRTTDSYALLSCTVWFRLQLCMVLRIVTGVQLRQVYWNGHCIELLRDYEGTSVRQRQTYSWASSPDSISRWP